jgi:hypothetical protein
MSTDADAEDLDALPFEELRRRAFHRAERHGDLAFFWDLVKHLPSSSAIATEDGTIGGLGDSIGETVQMVREMFGHELGDAEPLLRARFVEYLRRPD